jgi:acetylornithine/succinyldiaminopimelate/putrescine aminotransferase
MRAPPPGWLGELQAAAHAAGALVIHDEVFSGLGRAGTFLASESEAPAPGAPSSLRRGVRPDLLCLGKALGGGFPISACLGTAAAMDAWGASTGEAIHTQTFLGNPVGCAMAAAVLHVIDEQGLPARAAELGQRWAEGLATVPGVRRITGRGLMLGVVIDDALGITRRMLERGWIVLPCGEHAEALGLTPPLTIAEPLLDAAVAALRECV